ncbi:MAG TPA: hypothetical protein VG826_25965 [Pirellulales bacterium]|nr:hypothetical protein [Pirellulales bacterium]
MKRKASGKRGGTKSRNAAALIHRVQKAVRRFIPGDVDLTDELLEERKKDAALGLAAAQKYFCGLAPPERILSEELLAERREEAKRE